MAVIDLVRDQTDRNRMTLARLAFDLATVEALGHITEIVRIDVDSDRDDAVSFLIHGHDIEAVAIVPKVGALRTINVVIRRVFSEAGNIVPNQWSEHSV